MASSGKGDECHFHSRILQSGCQPLALLNRRHAIGLAMDDEERRVLRIHVGQRAGMAGTLQRLRVSQGAAQESSPGQRPVIIGGSLRRRSS